MTPELLKAFYRIALLVLGASIALLLVVPPDSAEYIVTLMSVCVGSILLALVIAATWYINR